MNQCEQKALVGLAPLCSYRPLSFGEQIKLKFCKDKQA